MSVWHPVDVCSEGSSCAIICENAGSAFIAFEKKCKMHDAMGLSDEELDRLIRIDSVRWNVCALVMSESYPDVVAGLKFAADRSLKLEIISAKDVGLADEIAKAVADRMAVHDPLVKLAGSDILPSFACEV